MKRIIPLLFLAFTLSPLAAQQADLMAEGVRAYQTGDYATAKSLFQSMLSLNPRNTAARNYLGMIAQKEKSGPGIQARLKQIVLPKVDFQSTSPQDAMTYVSQQVNKTIDNGQKLNIVWLVPAATEVPQITLSLQNAPANEVLRYIAEMAGLKLDYEEYAVKVSVDKPADATPATEPVSKTP